MNIYSITDMTDSKAIQPSGKPSLLQQAGQAANRAASKRIFDDYRERRADNTLRAQDANLALFTAFLTDKLKIPVHGGLCCDPEAWNGITWGLVEAFKLHMLNEGYAIASVNLALSNIKVYAKLASKAESLDKLEYLQIKDISGYTRKEAKKVNEKRSVTRRPGGKKLDKEGNIVGPGKSNKKAKNTEIPADDAKRLKTAHPDTPQGRRDALLMSLLLDLGLRCGEVALLKVSDVNLEAGLIKVSRPKVDLDQTHRMTGDVTRAMKRYFSFGDVPDDPDAPLLRSSRKGGKLSGAGMAERSITQRVNVLGKGLGLERLSAHDCRHFWATDASNNETPIEKLMQAGGWSSPNMPMRYIDAAEIANEGVKLSVAD